MTHMAEVVLFHLRHNGDVYIAHWYLILLIVWIAIAIIGAFYRNR